MNFSTMNPALKVLEQTFGYSQFRGFQQEVIEAVLRGEDCLVLMPTGGGKSLCYQIPALLKDGVAVVVSPLIALMKDQVDMLEDLGVSAAYLNSTQSFEESQNVIERLHHGDVSLLYVSPERLMSERTLQLLNTLPLSLFAIDEAHCISIWGHDFRPEYGELSLLKERFPRVPRIALTATADEQTRLEIMDRLLIEPRAFIASFDRPNIRYRINEKSRGYLDEVVDFIRGEHLSESGIIYCLSRRKCEEVAQHLRDKGIDALYYHAGMDQKEREVCQNQFYERACVMVATIAFGMGIDKPDVRYVIHLDMPRSIENYFQETGRAGRDDRPAEAVLYYGLEDVVNQRRLIDQSDADETYRQVVLAKLDQMLALAESAGCRRTQLLAYFGEQASHCDNCDNCENPPSTRDVTLEARQLLSCIHRCYQTNGVGFGAGHVINVITGTMTDRIRERGHDQLTTWGLGQQFSSKFWRQILRQLVIKGYVSVRYEMRNVLVLTEKSRALLKGLESFEIKISGTKTLASRKALEHADLSEDERELFERLRAWRKVTAQEAQKPPYLILTDASLLQLCKEKPQTKSQLMQISGIGEKKYERYHRDIFQMIEDFAN